VRVAVNDTELYLDVEGAQLAVDGERLRARPTLVVLHGGPGFDQGYLRPGLRPLADDAQLLFVDLRGQGRSGRPPTESCTLEQMADDVAALCRCLGVERPIVFGHSSGGFVALQLALRHPSLPAGLVLCATSPTLQPLPDADPPPALADRAGDEADAVAKRLFGGDFSAATLEAFGEQVAPFYAAPGHMDVPGRLLALSTMNADVARHFFTTLAPRYDLRPRLGEIATPALVLFGRHDWVCSPAAGRCIAEGLAAAELVELPDAGHFPFSETPAPCLEAVREHIFRP